MIKAIALDLDGTLVKPGVLEITAADRAAIAEAAQAGVSVILATARTPAQARHFQAELGITGPVIGNNGALAELGDGTELVHRRIDAGCTHRIVSALVSADLFPNVIQGSQIFRRRRPGYPLGPQITRVSFCEYASELVDDLAPYIADGATQIGVTAATLGEILPVLASEAVCVSRYYDADTLAAAVFNHSDASKGDALRAAARHLGVDLAEVLAIGDSEADLSMFTVAGAAVAVANASPTVRAAAHWVAPAQWESGVAAAIARYL